MEINEKLLRQIIEDVLRDMKGSDKPVRRGDLFKITVIRCDLTEFVVIQGDRRKRLSR